MALRSMFITLVLCVTIAAQVASAQQVTLNQYQGAPTPDDGFAVMRPVVPGHLRFGARLHLDYANDPLVFEDVRGQPDSERTSVVRDQLTANMALSIGLGESSLLYAGLPINLLMKGTSLVGLPRATGTGLGDAYIGGRLVLVAGDGDEGMRLAVDGQLSLPTARAADAHQQLAGESGVSGSLRAMLEGSVSTLRVGVNAGLGFRPDTELAGTRMRDEILFELSLMQPLVGDVLFAHLEAFGKSSRDDFARNATTPISALLGLRLSVAGLTFGLAGGAGIVRGYGAPDARFVFSAAVTVPERESLAVAVEAEAVVEPEPAARQAPRPLGTDDVQGGFMEEPYDEAPAEPEPAVAPAAVAPAAVTPAAVAPAAVAPAAVTPAAVTPAAATPPLPTPAPPVPVAPTRAGDADQDRVNDDVDQCPRAPGEAGNRGCPERVRLDLDRRVIEFVKEIKFGDGGTAVLGRSFSTLEELLAILKANPDLRIRIEAHMHNEPAAAASVALTEARAGSIRDLLIEWEIDAARVSAYGCGSIRPISPNDKAWGRKANERIEVHIVAPRAAGPPGCHPSP